MKKSEDKLMPGWCLKLKNKYEYHLILKIIGNAFVQDYFDGKWSTQSRNEEKGTVLFIWDGKFLNKISLKELVLLYDEFEEPDTYNESIMTTLNTINNNWK